MSVDVHWLFTSLLTSSVQVEGGPTFTQTTTVTPTACATQVSSSLKLPQTHSANQRGQAAYSLSQCPTSQTSQFQSAQIAELNMLRRRNGGQAILVDCGSAGLFSY